VIKVLPATQRRIEEWAFDVRAVFHHLHANVALELQLLEVVVDDLTRIQAVVDLGPHGWKLALDLAVLDRVFKLFRTPAGPPIERQPLIQRPAVRLQVERKHTRVRDRVVRTEESMVRLLAIVVDRFARHLGNWPALVAQRQARHAAHVAILALNALLARRRRSVLFPHHLKFDSRMHGHLVARRAELAARERLEVHAGDVHVLAGAFVLGRRLQLEVALAFDGRGHTVAPDAAEHGRVNVALLNAPFAVRFAVGKLHAVARDARNAIAGRLGLFPQRQIARQTQRDADRRMTS
jgi:hypothetical protein